MNRRVRHFNPRFAGADFVIDSRYINQSNNTSVSSWSDISGNANNVSQSTGINQPTFLTGQQGGNPGVKFDGSNDFMIGSFNPTGVPRSIQATIKGNGGVYDQPNYNGTIFQVPQRPGIVYGFITRWGNVNSGTLVAGDIANTNFYLSSVESNVLNPVILNYSVNSSRNVSFFRDGISKSVLGNPLNVMSTPITNGCRIGSVLNTGNEQFEYFSGIMYNLSVWQDEEITATLRRRCQQSAAFSFKIACS